MASRLQTVGLIVWNDINDIEVTGWLVRNAEIRGRYDRMMGWLMS